MPYEKVGDNEPVCIADEVPFEIPDGWEWCRLKNISTIFGGKRIPIGNKLTTENTGHIYIRVADMKNESVDINNLLYVPHEVFPQIKKYTINKEDIYITVAGTIGLIGKIPIELDGANLTENADKIVFKFINQNWLIKCMQSYYVKSQIDDAITKVGQPKLAIKRIEDFLIPLPPLQEQQRIVTEIEKYLPLINEYDKLQTELDTLDKEFPEKLKKSISQEAIKGKLVEQDPSDEPASVLLDKIRKEKEKLIKEGKIKKDKNESIIYKRDNSYYEKLNGIEKCIDDEIPFEIPESWEWARFNSIVYYHMGKTPPRKDSKYWENASHNWISIADMVANGIIKNTKEKVNDYSVKNIFKNQFSKKGTLIMSFKLTVGRVSILGIDAYHNEAIISILPYYDIDNIIRNYLFIFLPLITTYGDTKTAIKGKTLNSASIDNLLIPIPPINEQNRTVKHIVELFAKNVCFTNL